MSNDTSENKTSIKTYDEYGGFVLNKDTNLRECLFVTDCSELLAELRAREKALYLNEIGKGNYQPDDIIVYVRTVEEIRGGWSLIPK